MEISNKSNQLLEKVGKQPKNAEKEKNIKIVGTAYDLNHDGKQYYVATDGEDYYIFTGQQCMKPNITFGYEDEYDAF